ncbi:MAG: hypothetical protein BGO54_21960 [Sphingobacteriales bacterium 46-32]|nr:MAG: hypothetical protein BGO54_21960 [Sphingobacteriales bacterium 46-32]
MKLFFTILMLTTAVSSVAQTVRTDTLANGIYLSDSDFQKHNLTNGFNKSKSIKLLDNSSHFISIKTDSSKHKFYYDEIWGYRKNGLDWRIYNADSYQVDYVGKVCIYSLVEGMPGNTSRFLYFSTGLNTPIHPISRKTLSAAFHSNTTFMETLKKFPITKSLTKWDKENKCYRFITWL